MNYKRILGMITIETVAYAVSGAASGWVGAKILDTANYLNYIPWEAATKGATGTGIVGFAVSTLKEIIAYLRNKSPNDSDEDKKVKTDLIETIGEIILFVGTNTLGSMLGHAILKSVTEMALNKTVASSAVGAALLSTLLICAACCSREKNKEEETKTTTLVELAVKRTSQTKISDDQTTETTYLLRV